MVYDPHFGGDRTYFPNPIKGFMDQIMNVAPNQMYPEENWNPEWNKYVGNMMDYIQGKIPDSYGGSPVGWGGSQGLRKKMDQPTWDAVGNWYQKHANKGGGVVPSGTTDMREGFKQWKDPQSQYRRDVNAGDYVRMAMDKPGWNQAWGQHENAIADYLSGSLRPGQALGKVEGVDQKTWRDISNWYEKSGIPGLPDWLKQQRRYGYK